MTISEIVKGGAGGAFILLTLLQIAPIKINPWTWLIRAFGRALNHDIQTKVDKLSDSISTLQKDLSERDAVDARVRILRFGDECRLGVKHSKDYFDQIMADITLYENYCGDHPNFKNNMTTLTIAHINKIFARCLETNDFL